MSIAWLMLVRKNNRVHGGNLGYDDDESSYYSWDNTVPSFAKPKAGDKIILWDSKALLGASVIEKIIRGGDNKII